jgi:hypothetical protein
MTDAPCTQEDRDKIVDAAKKRVFEIYTLADALESYSGAKMSLPNGMRATMVDAAAQLRQLIE